MKKQVYYKIKDMNICKDTFIHKNVLSNILVDCPIKTSLKEDAREILANRYIKSDASMKNLNERKH